MKLEAILPLWGMVVHTEHHYGKLRKISFPEEGDSGENFGIDYMDVNDFLKYD